MLRGISPLLSPELLAALYRMGHGDALVLADAHFPGESLGRRVLRADGLDLPEGVENLAEPGIVICAVAAPRVGEAEDEDEEEEDVGVVAE